MSLSEMIAEAIAKAGYNPFTAPDIADVALQAIASHMLDPDMPAQELRLHMGESTAQEERTARAAIRWANSKVMS